MSSLAPLWRFCLSEVQRTARSQLLASAGLTATFSGLTSKAQQKRDSNIQLPSVLKTKNPTFPAQ